MSADPDLRLRAALRELSDVPPPADPATAALARARHDRRRSTLLVAGTAAAVAAAVAVPTAVLRDRAATTAPGAPGTTSSTQAGSPPPTRPAPRQQLVTAYTMVDGAAASMLLDPATGRYVRLAAHLDLSPDGRRVAVAAEWEGATRLGVADRTALLRDGLGIVRWLDRRIEWSGVEWSPDGERLLLTGGIKGEPPVRAYVVDGATGTVQHELRFPSITEPVAQAFSWSPDGRDIYLQLAAGTVQFFDLEGRPTRRWQGLGRHLSGRWSASSPSGRLLAVETLGAGPGSKSAIVLDTGTGRVVARLPEPAPARPGQPAETGAVVGWYDESHLLRLRRVPQPGRPSPTPPGPAPSPWITGPASPTAAGPLLATLALDVVDLRGRVIWTVPLPGAPQAEEVVVGSAAGVSRAGAATIF